MKTLDEITAQFDKDLKEMGVTAYAYIVSDPDSNTYVWGSGGDLVWILGATEILADKAKNSLARLREEDDKDDYL